MPGFPLLLTSLTPCHARFLTVTNCVGSTPFQASHCHSLRWLQVTPSFSLPFTKVTSQCPRCVIASHGVTLHFPSCFTATDRDGFASYPVTQCHSLVLLIGISSVILQITMVALCFLKCSTATHQGGLVLSQGFYCRLLGHLHFFSCPTPAYQNGSCNFMFLTDAYQGGSVPLKVIHCHSLKQVCVILYIPLLYPGMDLHSRNCFNTAHYGGSISFQGPSATHQGWYNCSKVPFCCLLWWLSVISCVPQTVTEVTLTSHICPNDNFRVNFCCI